MLVLIGQVSPIVGDVQGNLELCLAAVSKAKANGCALGVLPELVLCGYPPRDLLHRSSLISDCAAAANRLIDSSAGDLTVVFGSPTTNGQSLHNSALVAHNGKLVSTVNKTLLPTYDVFDEKRHFTAGSNCAGSIGKGSSCVEVGGVKLGITICEDIWGDRNDSNDPVNGLPHCDLLLNISATPFYSGKSQVRKDLVSAVSKQVESPVIYCNMVGGNDELLFDGRSMVVAADGSFVHESMPWISSNDVVDVFKPVAEPPYVPTSDSLDSSEDLVEALTMGVRDYASRCGFTTAVLGLSGGVDSALVAAIAVRALGSKNVFGVAMPGPYSSEGSVTDSELLAKNLGISLVTLPILKTFDALLDTLALPFKSTVPDVTEENLQARTRGLLLMAMSNKFGHLLLTTGNKSEMAVGYCTLYGDMNGGLAVISDLFKGQVYELSRWFNRKDEVIPYSTITKPPSAELAPDQRDSDSLPPYDVLDDILKRYVENNESVGQMVAAGHSEEMVSRIIMLVDNSEYKRWQSAPGLRVSQKAFGTGRRIPLAKRLRR